MKDGNDELIVAIKKFIYSQEIVDILMNFRRSVKLTLRGDREKFLVLVFWEEILKMSKKSPKKNEGTLLVSGRHYKMAKVFKSIGLLMLFTFFFSKSL